MLRPSRKERSDKGSGDGATTIAKIGLISTLLAALIAAIATVLVAVINHEPGPASGDSALPGAGAGAGAAGPKMPPPSCDTCGAGGKTFTEQVHSSNPAGTTTFKDPRGYRGKGPPVPTGQRVEVVCRFLDPNATASVQPGWWYLIDSPPWNRQYYTPANSYLNGDLPEGPYITDVDGRVPVC